MAKCNNHYPIMEKWEKIKDESDYFVMKCPKCGMSEVVKRHKGVLAGDSPVAIYDVKGEQVAVNKKGNIVENKYKNDSRGWKRSGKKIANFDSHNRKLKENYR